MTKRQWTDAELQEALALKGTGAKWREVAAHFDCTVDAIRSAVKGRGLEVPKVEKADTPPEAPKEPDTLETRTAKARDAMERKHEKHLFKQLLDEKARTEVIVEGLQAAVQALPRVYTPLPTVIIKPTQKPEEAILTISDSQIGQWTRQEETGGLGHYNLDVFAQRAERLRQSVLEISETHRSRGGLPVLNVFFAGDIVDGEAIFPNQLAHIDLDVAGQLMLGVDTFAPFLISLLEVYPTVRVLSVSGNHGRSGHSKKEPGMRFRSNWDYIMAQFLRARLIQYADRIQWNVPESWFAIQEVQGKRFLVHHYDVVKSWMNLPYYGLDRYDSRFSRVLHARGMHYDYMIGGHFHNYANVETPTGEWIINGAWPGASYHSLRDLAVASSPSQMMFGVHPERGLTWRYKIGLAEDPAVDLVMP